MSRTFSSRMKVSSKARKSSRNEGRPRIGQTRIAARNMPATIIHRQWLNDGTQVAIAQVNDLFVAARFDANENPLGAPVKFTGGQARANARAWADKTAKTVRGF